jgi:DNA-directed RNA polymerase subunit H (RpoH/RPB5)
MKKTDIPQSEFQVPDGYSNVPMKKFFHLDAQEEMQMPSGEDMKKMFEEMGIDPENLPEMFQQKQ